MRYAVISDLHANLEAVQAVFAALDGLGVDQIVCLGDLVGYHANPNEVVEVVRARVRHAVAGNHDRAATAAAVPSYFSDRARRGVEWTRARLSARSAGFLDALPGILPIDAGVLLVHGALHPVPNEHTRLSDAAAAFESFAAMERDFPAAQICFFGHIHLPLAYEWRDGCVLTHRDQRLRLDGGARYLICPGSVGQPRDGDPRSAFVVFDSEDATIEYHRVPYDRDACQRKLERAGLAPRRSLLRRIAGRLRRAVRPGSR